MPVYTAMGLKKIYVADAKEDGTMPAKGTAWKDLGDVYQDTCQLVDSDPETTVHKSETSNRKLTQVGETETTVNLSLMDPDLELLARYFGGTIDGEKGARKWKRPKKLPYKEWAIWQQPEEGIFVGCANARIIPKFEITYSKTGICLVPMTIGKATRLCPFWPSRIVPFGYNMIDLFGQNSIDHLVYLLL